MAYLPFALWNIPFAYDTSAMNKHTLFVLFILHIMRPGPKSGFTLPSGKPLTYIALFTFCLFGPWPFVDLA